MVIIDEILMGNLQPSPHIYIIYIYIYVDAVKRLDVSGVIKGITIRYSPSYIRNNVGFFFKNGNNLPAE